MTKKPNPRATYKAQLLNYDNLLAASDKECSYCLSEREIQMLLAFVDYIAWKTRYQVTETEIDQNLIDNWSANLARKLMNGCCGDDGTQHRITELGVWQTSTDGGNTWYDDPASDPRNNNSYYPPLLGPDGDDKACEGATNAFEFFKQNLIDELATGLAYSEIYSAIVGILAVLGVTGIGIVVAIAAAAIFVAGVVVVQAAFTSEVWADFKCILYCNISDDASYTTDQWTTVKAQVYSSFTGIVQVVLWNWVNALGAIGLTNAARSNMGLGSDCSDCECSTCPCNLFQWNWSPAYGSPSAALFTRTEASCSLTADGLYHDPGTGLYYFGVYAPTGCTMGAGIVSGSVNVFHGYIPAAHTGSYSWFDTSEDWVSGIIPGPANCKAIIMISTVPFAPYAFMA